MKTILFNGEHRPVEAGNIRQLLTELGVQEGTVAVALNEEFVPLSQYSETPINTHDSIEIVAPMQGG
ncbi:sulfur carrier protein ThiS [Aestuariibacter sp. AA17]|uniref:Sulfur carrier protein ThiS n=1 Tax=Fluctibacter corallii TaxID=2984329 RepID=A0ABT3AC68_9ALTE|nr:sulfur carrier protein ThiS [Aestuariibacter sp. AA17]MCV2886224.1 sulfur carrier protein ThiS [Aestuariibacter sp. AA17]